MTKCPRFIVFGRSDTLKCSHVRPGATDGLFYRLTMQRCSGLCSALLGPLSSASMGREAGIICGEVCGLRAVRRWVESGFGWS